MSWEELSTGFLQAMVQGMYRCEAAQVNVPGLLTNDEMLDTATAAMFSVRRGQGIYWYVRWWQK